MMPFPFFSSRRLSRIFVGLGALALGAGALSSPARAQNAPTPLLFSGAALTQDFNRISIRCRPRLPVPTRRLHPVSDLSERAVIRLMAIRLMWREPEPKTPATLIAMARRDRPSGRWAVCFQAVSRRLWAFSSATIRAKRSPGSPSLIAASSIDWARRAPMAFPTGSISNVRQPQPRSTPRRASPISMRSISSRRFRAEASAR